MALSAAERQKNRRDRLRQQEKISLRLHLNHALHSKLKRQAARKGVPLQDHAVATLAKHWKG